MNPITQLINQIDALLIPEAELGLGEIGELRDEIQAAIDEGLDYITLDAASTRSGKIERVNFAPNILED